ncbi:MAG: serine/threonine-protein kinase [Candidatus Sumerlaeota bacterium]
MEIPATQTPQPEFDEKTRIVPNAGSKKLPPKIAQYEVIKQLGEGGMGIVLLGRDADLHRDVAIKLVRQELQANDAFIERFLREARLCAALNHPNVVTTHQVGRHHGLPFIVLEFVDGMSLRELIRTPPPLPVDRILDFIAQAGDGLEAAARRGIVHRDVKPANIMVRRDNLVKVMDFGLSKEVEGERLTMTSALVGTPDYMSPEQAGGRSVDFRTDIYALGISLFQCLTGYLPFKSSSVFETIRMHAEKPLPEDPRLASIVDGRILMLIKHMTEKRVEDRLSSYEELRRELKTLKEMSVGIPANVGGSVPIVPQHGMNLHDVIEHTETAAKEEARKPSPTPKSKSTLTMVGQKGGAKSTWVVVAAALALLGIGGGATYYFTQPSSSGSRTTLPVEKSLVASRGVVAVPEANSRNVIAGPVTINTAMTLTGSAADVLQNVGALGSNHLMGAGLAPELLPVSCSFKERTPLDVLESLALAEGWSIKEDGTGLRTIAKDNQSAVEKIERSREQLNAENLPRVNANTVGQRVTIRMFCETVSKQTGYDFLIVGTDIAQAPFPQGSFTNQPLPMMMELINKNSMRIEWTVYKSTLVIIPAAKGAP